MPSWLYDGNDPNFDFGTYATFEIAAGRTNLLAVPFIPGDSDRDGVCDANDIAKLASVFGDDNWIFSNSFSNAPEGDEVDPATQTKPWDVDATGDNGVEASDLQWTLNFQGDVNGQIVGLKYGSTTAASDGVYLNPNTGVECTFTTSVNVPGGRTISTLLPCDTFEVTVSGQVTSGANTTSGQKNGIMQFAQDLEVNVPGIVKVTSVTALGSFSKTRASLESLQGTSGDRGVNLINGYTTSFTQGTSSAAQLYRVTLQVIGKGDAEIIIWPASATRFAAGTPEGVKIGHTASNGDPNSTVYPSVISITALSGGDINNDNDVDFDDLAIMGSQWQQAPGSPSADIAPAGGDNIVNFRDLGELVKYWLEEYCD